MNKNNPQDIKEESIFKRMEKADTQANRRKYLEGIKDKWIYDCNSFCNIKRKHKHKFKTIFKPNLHVLVAGRQVMI